MYYNQIVLYSNIAMRRWGNPISNKSKWTILCTRLTTNTTTVTAKTCQLTCYCVLPQLPKKILHPSTSARGLTRLCRRWWAPWSNSNLSRHNSRLVVVAMAAPSPALCRPPHLQVMTTTTKKTLLWTSALQAKTADPPRRYRYRLRVQGKIGSLPSSSAMQATWFSNSTTRWSLPLAAARKLCCASERTTTKAWTL